MAELDQLHAAGSDVTYQALREMPWLEAAIKEALRLHPPLILVLRVAQRDLEVEGHRIAAGQMVGATLAVSNRLPEAEPSRTGSDPSATWNRNRTTWPTRGTGSLSAPGATGAWAPLLP